MYLKSLKYYRKKLLASCYLGVIRTYYFQENVKPVGNIFWQNLFIAKSDVH